MFRVSNYKPPQLLFFLFFESMHTNLIIFVYSTVISLIKPAHFTNTNNFFFVKAESSNDGKNMLCKKEFKRGMETKRPRTSAKLEKMVDLKFASGDIMFNMIFILDENAARCFEEGISVRQNRHCKGLSAYDH